MKAEFYASKCIIQFALIQVGVLAYGILFTAVSVKFWAKMLESDPKLPLPAAVSHAFLFRDYGIIFSLLILGWVVSASYAEYSAKTPPLFETFIGIAGAAIIVLLFVIGSYYAITPIICLLSHG